MRKTCTVLAAFLLSGAVQGAAQDAPATAEAAKPGKQRDYERIGRFIYAFHRAGVSVEQLTDPTLARRAPPELAQRAGALAVKYEQIVANQATAPDHELKATLREAELVGATIAQWWKEQDGTSGLSRP
jgi:hypothetical protein